MLLLLRKIKPTLTMALFLYSQLYISRLCENELWLYYSTYSIADSVVLYVYALRAATYVLYSTRPQQCYSVSSVSL